MVLPLREGALYVRAEPERPSELERREDASLPCDPPAGWVRGVLGPSRTSPVMAIARSSVDTESQLPSNPTVLPPRRQDRSLPLHRRFAASWPDIDTARPWARHRAIPASHPPGIDVREHRAEAEASGSYQGLWPRGRGLHPLPLSTEVASTAKAGPCDGTVHTIRGRTIVFTGVVRDGDTHVVQETCGHMAVQKRATYLRDFTSAVDLVVWGDLDGKRVQDPRHQFSEKLVRAKETRGHSSDRHVHVVDADGFFDLLTGRSAPCRRIYSRRGVLGVTRRDDDKLLGGTLVIHRPTPHNRTANALLESLDSLDRGTKAHQDTLAELRDYLAEQGVRAKTPYRNGPRFDAGWMVTKTLYVAEVKSLPNRGEEQQIRLGLGQILDYAEQIHRRSTRLRLVLVVEREPQDVSRWVRLCKAHGVHLAWPPFSGRLVRA